MDQWDTADAEPWAEARDAHGGSGPLGDGAAAAPGLEAEPGSAGGEPPLPGNGLAGDDFADDEYDADDDFDDLDLGDIGSVADATAPQYDSESGGDSEFAAAAGMAGAEAESMAGAAGGSTADGTADRTAAGAHSTQGGIGQSEPPPPTGDPRVDAAVARLADLATLPVAEHPAVFAEVHQGLTDALRDLGEATDGAGDRPGR